MKTGDKFLINPDLSIKDDYYGSPGYISDLEKYRGQIVTVKQAHVDGMEGEEHGEWFTVEEKEWTWSLRWVTEVNEKKLKK